MPPQQYWLNRLFLDLRANNSDHIRIYSDTAGTIERLLEASGTYCLRLDLQFIERSVVLRERNAEVIAAPIPRRGYRTEVQRWMAGEEISNLDDAARRLGISRSALKSIMSERGKR